MKYLTNYVPQGGGMSDGYVAVEENGELKLQKLSFNGTEATPDGATETMLEVGLFATGMDEPAYAGSGGGSSMKFYQCTAVDTESNTWSGKELILTNGKYAVSSDVTTGLVYTTATPAVGYIYSEDALIKVASAKGVLPTDGLVFYAPLAEASDTAETGQAFTANTTITHTVEQGIPCMRVEDFTGYFADTGLPSGSSSRTLSCWVKRDEQFSSASEATFFSYGTGDYGLSVDFCFHDQYNNYSVDLYGSPMGVPTVYDHTQWHHVLYTFDSETYTASIYVDGVLGVTSTSHSPSTVLSGKIYIGTGASGDWPFGQGYLAACRVYNRALSQEEITALASEFTPTTA